ncbi:MAG: diguanylate cyclase [Acidobacteriota bacterium]|nr:diguanylate cyclase [Acidobacteriota bacterium]
MALTWSEAGVVGVGLTAGAALWHLGRLMPQRLDPGMAVGWLLIAIGQGLGTPVVADGPRGAGGALVVAGLMLIGRSLPGGSKGATWGWAGILLLTVLALGMASFVLPGVMWRGLYGLALLLVAIWLGQRAGEHFSRQLFGLGIALLAIAGTGLMVTALRPSLELGLDGVIGVLVLGGMVGVAAATILDQAGAEVDSLRNQLIDLEDDHEHLLRLSEADPLTGCPTRQALRAWFDRWDGGQPVSVVLIDVDNLKRINERHGHAVGDEALRLVADILMGSIRPGDLVVRWGGDEFVVVLRGADHEAAKRRFTGLISSLQESTEKFPYDEQLRVDWGVSSCVSPPDISRALAEADERMFAMKRRR